MTNATPHPGGVSLPPSLQDERVERVAQAIRDAVNTRGGYKLHLLPEIARAAIAALSTAQADAEVERLRNALWGLLNAQTSRERAYAAIEAHAALSEERTQVSDARLLVRSEAKETPHV